MVGNSGLSGTHAFVEQIEGALGGMNSYRVRLASEKNRSQADQCTQLGETASLFDLDQLAVSRKIVASQPDDSWYDRTGGNIAWTGCFPYGN
jgi:hypothetical protein